MPRRQVADRFAGPLADLLLHTADWLAPRLRGFSRWRHGGPLPQFRPPEALPKVYRDDVRNQAELSFATTDPQARTHLLDHLQSLHWQPRPGTEAWDLELKPYLLLTTLEILGHDFFVLRIRTLHPPGHLIQITRQLESAALDIGLHPVS